MVSTDKLVTANAFAVPSPICAQRTSAQPNLVRVSTPEEHVFQAPSSRRTVYKFDASAGYNQNYYVIDSGVRKDHAALPTVQWAGNFVNNAEVDDFGHGNPPAPCVKNFPEFVVSMDHGMLLFEIEVDGRNPRGRNHSEQSLQRNALRHRRRHQGTVTPIAYMISQTDIVNG